MKSKFNLEASSSIPQTPDGMVVNYNFTVCLIFKIQASLVIRDLTLRVFAITRFREKNP